MVARAGGAPSQGLPPAWPSTPTRLSPQADHVACLCPLMIGRTLTADEAGALLDRLA